MAKPSNFRFRNVDHIGAADAEDDREFLTECFVDTGELDQLVDLDNPRRIVIGRTGAGKTTLLAALRDRQDRTIVVQPESLSLAYISNSTILRFFMKLDVKLDIFFRLLWRHVFTVELLKRHFEIKSEADKRTFLQRCQALISSVKNRRTLEYLEKWGKTFWEETEYRIREVTSKLESDLAASAKAVLPKLVDFSSEAASHLTKKETKEIHQRAQKVVNDVQIRQLSDILDLMDQVLSDPQKKYFLVIDRLDEDWIEDALRYRLIRALIETTRDFRKVRNAKIVVALRLDLLDRVFRLTRDAGFQEEKYQSTYLQLSWSKEHLVQLLDARIGRLIRSRYTSHGVAHGQILPRKVNGDSSIDYMLKRTMMRPRDLILFFNECIQAAQGKAVISTTALRTAEGVYSRQRLRSLSDEWVADFPNLMRFTDLLKGARSTFELGSLSDAKCEDFALDSMVHGFIIEDMLSSATRQVLDLMMTTGEFRLTVIRVFYRVGIVGLKLEPHEPTVWTDVGRPSISRSEISDSTRVSVHPMLWRVLGVRPT